MSCPAWQWSAFSAYLLVWFALRKKSSVIQHWEWFSHLRLLFYLRISSLCNTTSLLLKVSNLWQLPRLHNNWRNQWALNYEASKLAILWCRGPEQQNAHMNKMTRCAEHNRESGYCMVCQVKLVLYWEPTHNVERNHKTWLWATFWLLLRGQIAPQERITA